MFEVDMAKLVVGSKVLFEKDGDAVLETVTKLTGTPENGGIVIYTDWYTDEGTSRRDWYQVKTCSGLRVFADGWDVAKIYA